MFNPLNERFLSEFYGHTKIFVQTLYSYGRCGMFKIRTYKVKVKMSRGVHILRSPWSMSHQSNLWFSLSEYMYMFSYVR